MFHHIQKVAVIGSGIMGSGIAAHLANAGIPTLLFDLVPSKLTNEEKKKGLTLKDKEVRNRQSELAVKKLIKQTPPPLASKEINVLIVPCNLEDDFERLKEVDWIIEAIIENKEAKQQLFKRIDTVRKQGTIVSSNTSGISIKEMSDTCSDDFKTHFLGTHFFNPPRYLKLLEIIPTAKTDKGLIKLMKNFGENVLGKGVVIGKDTPNFIANRIGTYGLLLTVKEMMENGYSVGEMDSVTGTLIGRPKSATFRTLDVVGLDTFLHVANTVYEQVDGKEQGIFTIPSFMKQMVKRGWLGSKSGQGFYVKRKDQSRSEIFELNPRTFEYEKRKKLKSPSIEKAKQEKDLTKRLNMIVSANDETGKLVWNLLKPVLLYSAEKMHEIAGNLQAIDQAMKWGFGWEFGPFELWDALDVEKTASRMEEEGDHVPDWVKQMILAGNECFYKENSYYHEGEYVTCETNDKIIHLRPLKRSHVVMKNNGATLLDIGDDVALLEFHSLNNSIGLDVIHMINQSIAEVEKNYKGLVISHEGKIFCVGANLMMILLEAQDQNFFEIDFVIKQFQQATNNIRYAQKPVVTAPFGMTLGGGAELCLPSASVQAAFETYIGLVEVGVGLIPGGGGNKELYRRHLERLPHGTKLDLQEIANHTFETIALANVSTSAYEAKENGFLSERDGIIMNRNFLISRAKQQVLYLESTNYRPPLKKKIPVVGESGYATMLLGAQMMKFGGKISEHDLKIAKKLAFVIAGGRLPKETYVDEQYLLDLEREAFLSLIGERKTLERMQHMLVRGKPLRN